MLDLLQYWVGEYGYLALFFLLWLGIVGLPVPDEGIVLSGGAIAGLGILHPIPAFIFTYLGVVSGLSIGYILGRFLQRYSERIQKGKEGYLTKAQSLVERYGTWGLSISYLFPVVRHLVPYLVGAGKMSFRTYATFSYTAGFIWTLLYFGLGYFLGEKSELWTQWIASYGTEIGIGVVAMALILLAIKYRYRRSVKGERELDK